MRINLTWTCRVCVGMAFFCLLCTCLPSLTSLEWADQQHFAKTKMGYISLPSILNAIIGITCYHCVILKMVILHDVIKLILNCFFPFSLQKEQNLVSSKKKKKQNFFLTTQKKQAAVFFEKNRFSTTLMKIKTRLKHIICITDIAVVCYLIATLWAVWQKQPKYDLPY